MKIAGSPVETSVAARVLLLAVILSILAGLKLSVLPGTGPYGADGSFYANAARNVEEGAGLVTDVSMYHSGIRELPTPSRLIYPLWPLLAGYAARLLGLHPALNFLPPFFYLLSLLLLYLIASRLGARAGLPDGAWLTPAHLLVLFLGLNFQFFGPTTYPYTEGLGFCLAFASLLLLDVALRRNAILWSVLAAVAAGLALLTRSQLVIIGLSLLVVVAWTAISDRKHTAAAVAYAAAFAAMGAYWYFAVYHVVENPRVELSGEFRMWVEPSTTADWWRARFEGVLVSFSPRHPNSYFQAFQTAFLLPMAAIPIALGQWIRRRPRALRLSPHSTLAAACVLVALAGYASLNLFHQDSSFFVPWLFGYRHGLPLVFGIAVAAVYLWMRGPLARGATIAALAFAAIIGTRAIVPYITSPPAASPTESEAQLVRWLDASPRRPVLLAVRAQHLSVYTHTGIHWTLCRTSPDLTREMLAKLPIDYVIVYDDERPCAFVAGLGDLLYEKAVFGEGRGSIHLLARRAAPIETRLKEH
ncbi:MAG TPA: hypothetical protein VFO89_01700 [Thermoanaerobaculia bacterium]|nr:hypothetical protein [Thermoanaerobaculia bacterium]